MGITRSRLRLVLGALVVFLLAFPANSQVPGREPRRADSTSILTIQSELDYLKSAKRTISLTLKNATVRQIYDAVGKKAGIGIAYEGRIPGTAGQDVSFEKETVKSVLRALGERFDLSYRVDRPDKLTVIGELPD